MMSKSIAAAALLVMLAHAPEGAASTSDAPIPTSVAQRGYSLHAGATLRHPDATNRAIASTAAPTAAISGGEAAYGASSGLTASTADDYTTHSLTAQEEKLLNLLNSDRAARGLSPLRHDPALSRAARIKAEDMRDRNYFAHESPTYGSMRDMLTRFGVNFRGAGENIAHHATVEKAQAAFLSSEGHRRNILSPNWERVGVGVCHDVSGFVYAVQVFAR